MTNVEALSKLKELSNQLEKVDYSTITDLFHVFIKEIPIPIAKLEKNTLVDRARPNEGDTLFSKVADVDFITDQDVIDTKLVEFGRANKPHQPMFYGATESTAIQVNRITALYEVSKLLQDRDNSINIQGELYTIGRWRNSETLFLAEVVFAKNALKNNPDTRLAFTKQIELANSVNTEDKEFFIDLITFISDEFARKIITHHDYKISVVYTNLALTCPGVHGIAYPSVETDYYGQNVVFPPATRKKYLEVQTLATQRVHKNKIPIFINNHKNCESPNVNPDNLTWIYVGSKYLALEDEIMKHLGL